MKETFSLPRLLILNRLTPRYKEVEKAGAFFTTGLVVWGKRKERSRQRLKNLTLRKGKLSADVLVGGVKGKGFKGGEGEESIRRGRMDAVEDEGGI